MERIEDEYYKAYETRYKEVYKHNYLWSSKENTSDVIKTMQEYSILTNSKILEIGCGEGRDAIYLLKKGYQVLAVDYSKTVISKCQELAGSSFHDNFRQLDIIHDKLEEKYDFIYSVAVIHMFVKKSHRDAYYQFIKNHLTDNGIALIISMGNGKKTYESNIEEAFQKIKRTIQNNQKKIEVVTTSCKIVDWESLEKEIKENHLVIKKKWISKEVPEFNPAMCVVVSKK